MQFTCNFDKSQNNSFKPETPKHQIRSEQAFWVRSEMLQTTKKISPVFFSQHFKGIFFKTGHTLCSCECEPRQTLAAAGHTYSHCITFTSFPRGIQSPLVGACARNLLASSFPDSSGIQSSGFSSCSCSKNSVTKGVLQKKIYTYE